MAIQVWDGTKYVGAELAKFGPTGTLKEALIWDGTKYVKVWPNEPTVVQITGTSGQTSRDQFRQACIDHGTTYDTVVVLPFLLDTSQATHLGFMFAGCSSLTTVPSMNTSQVTDMRSMFYGCASLTRVPDMYTAKVDFAQNMFLGCAALTDGNVKLIIRKYGVVVLNMIDGSGLTMPPFVGAEGTIGQTTPAQSQLRTLGSYTITSLDGAGPKILKMGLDWQTTFGAKYARIFRNGDLVGSGTGQNPRLSIEVACNVGDVIDFAAISTAPGPADRTILRGDWAVLVP